MKYFKIIIAVLCCTLFSCVEDYEFAGDGQFSASKVEVKNAENHIELSCDVDKHAIAGKITEKGFYFTRKPKSYRNSYSDANFYTDKITLAPNDEFKYSITNDLKKGMECSVVAYVKEYDHEFTTNETSFTCEAVSTPPEISDVRFEYDDETKVTGKIIITGKNFGNSSQIFLRPELTGIKGKVHFELKEHNESMATFKYTCCYVADFPLTFNTFSSSIKLPKNLVVDGPKLNLGSTDVIMGVPQAFSITVGDTKLNNAVCKINGKKLNVSTDYLNNNELAFIPAGDFGTQTLEFSFPLNSDTVYFQPKEVKFVNAWKKIGSVTQYIGHESLKYAYGRIWYPDNNHIQAISLTNFKTKSYTPKRHDSFKWDDDRDRLIVTNDGIYLSENSDYDAEKVRIMKYDTQNDNFAIYQEVSIDNGEVNIEEKYHLFEIVGDDFYFRQSGTDNVKIWNRSTKKVTSKGRINADWSYYNYEYIGTDGKSFYAAETAGSSRYLYRYPINSLMTKESVDFVFDKIAGNGISTSNKYRIIHNGRIYQSGLMRSTRLSDLTDHIYYGIPCLGNWYEFILIPADNAMYCYDIETGTFYQYIGK